MISLLFVAATQACSFGYQGNADESKQDAGQSTRIEDGQTGEDTSIDTLVTKLADSEVVILGEQHDNDSGHDFQLQVIKRLVGNGHRVAISTEQFERDVQGAVDDYLRGVIDEAEFLKASRPWKNYQPHYRPIVEFAKANGIPVLAGNIPRRIASGVSTGEAMSFLDKPLMPRKTTTPKDAYWDRFAATMQGHLGVDGDAKLERFYASQCMKDDAMAETITDFMAVHSHKPKIVVHLCGHFHSDYGLGTAARVMSRRPLTKMTIITMESQLGSDKKMSKGRAHYVFFTVENKKKDSK